MQLFLARQGKPAGRLATTRKRTPAVFLEPRVHRFNDIGKRTPAVEHAAFDAQSHHLRERSNLLAIDKLLDLAHINRNIANGEFVHAANAYLEPAAFGARVFPRSASSATTPHMRFRRQAQRSPSGIFRLPRCSRRLRSRACWHPALAAHLAHALGYVVRLVAIHLHHRIGNGEKRARTAHHDHRAHAAALPVELRQNPGPRVARQEGAVYSREFKERTLADLAESGMTVAAFCRQPGRPSRQAVAGWLRLAERGALRVPEPEARGRCEHAKHARYPEATKREAASLLRAGMRPADAARRLGVASASLVSAWARKARGCATMSPKGAVHMDEGSAARIGELEAELARERLANAALRELMRDPKAGDPASLSNSQKAELC